MLSNVPNECYEKEFIDADKVYSKKEFFKLEQDYSIEKVRNIFRNIDRDKFQFSRLRGEFYQFRFQSDQFLCYAIQRTAVPRSLCGVRPQAVQ